VGTGTDFKAASTFTEGDKYLATFWVSEEHATTVTVEVTVSNRTAPSLYVPPTKTPAHNAPWGNAQYLEGVTVADAEEPLLSVADVKYGTITAGPNGILGDADDIFTEKANIVDTSIKYAVYAVDYWVTDADNNTARGKGYVLVGWTGTDYLVKAETFLTGSKNFTELQGTQTHLAGTDPFILEKSKAEALHFNPATGNLDDATELVLEASLYKAQGPLVTKAAYPDGRDFDLKIGVENPFTPGQPNVDIKARVIAGFVDGGPHYVSADSPISLTILQARGVSGALTAPTKAQLALYADARGWFVDENSNILPWDVDIQSSGFPADPNNVAAGASYKVVFIPKDFATDGSLEVTFVVDNGGSPIIAFTEKPLIITQTPGQSHVLTQAELKAKMTATDAEDDGTGGRAANYTFTNTTATVAGGGDIDTQNVNVYKVSYSVTDLDGNTTTATRAVVVDDGRYEYEDPDGDGDIDIIIGARDYAIQSKDVDGTEAQAKDLSYAEAYDDEGTALPVAWTGAPAGYSANAPVGDYAITWRATAGALTADKAITAHVVDADVIDPGDKDSQYAITANHFKANLAQAATILATDAFGAPAWADVKVIKLVATAADKTFLIEDRGGFQAVTRVNPGYLVTFRIDGIPAATQKVVIDAAVTQGQHPVISASTPYTWFTSQDPALFDPMYNVSASDAEDGTIALNAIDNCTGDENIDPTKTGIYPVRYTVKDNDGNTATADRVIVINDDNGTPDTSDDGPYIVGNNNIIAGNSFVTKASDVNILNLSSDVLAKSGAKLYNGTTGAEITGGVSVDSLGQYRNAAGVYPITLSGSDGGNARVTKGITAEVVDADVIKDETYDDNGNPTDPTDETADKVYIFAKNSTMTPDAAAALLASPSKADEIVALTHAGAKRVTPNNGLITNKPVDVDDWGNLDSAEGEYYITFSEPESGLTVTAKVTVDAGGNPVLTVPKPRELSYDASKTTLLTAAQIIEGNPATAADNVTAIDPEDGDVTDQVIVLKRDGSGSPAEIKQSEPGVYPVIFSITKDGVTITEPAAIVVNDGRFEINPVTGRILEAQSFVVKVADVPSQPSYWNIDLLLRSGAVVYDFDGNILAGQPVIRTNGGYKNVAGTYQASFQGFDKVITAEVVDADIIAEGPDGDGDGKLDDPTGPAIYVFGDEVHTTTSRVNALVADEAKLLDAMNAGGRSVAANGALSTIPRSNLEIKDLILTDFDGDGVNDDYIAILGPKGLVGPTAAIPVHVTNGTPPTLTTTNPYEIAVGTPFDPKNGVIVNDAEDGDITSEVQCTGAVDSNQPAVYYLDYSVTDSDGNTVTGVRTVVVNDGRFVVGITRILEAQGFTKDFGAVAGTDAELYDLAGARIHEVRGNGVSTPVNGVKVVNNGAYKKYPGVYQVTFQSIDEPALSKTITATLTGQTARYLVSFNANGGTLRGPLGLYVVAPSTTLAYLPEAPFRQGYTFVSWNTAANGSGAGFTSSSTVTRDVTVYAQWSLNPVTPPPTVVVNPPNVYVGGSTTTIVQPDGSIEPATYITVQPSDDLTSLEDDATPLDPSIAPVVETTSWSLFNICCAVLALLLFIGFIIKFFIDRKRKDEDEYYARQPRNRALYVNLPVLLVGLIALVETGILLFTTQDFAAEMAVFDSYSVIFALIVFVLLLAPMVAAAGETRHYNSLYRAHQPQTSGSQPPTGGVSL
jgi:uncharacterized repeat protein (TIGR02543 family)